MSGTNNRANCKEQNIKKIMSFVVLVLNLKEWLKIELSQNWSFEAVFIVLTYYDYNA
jgi:hypothetical protein